MIYSLIVLTAGFFVLVKGADWFVDGASSLASIFHVSQLVIGLTICAMGTSLPEAAVSLVAGLNGNSGITIGNVVGSNILNILIVLGMSALITKIKIEKSTLFIEIPYMLLSSLVLLVMGKSQQVVSFQEGLILIGMFIIYLLYLFWLSQKESEEEVSSQYSFIGCVLLIGLGIFFVMIGSQLVVKAATQIAYWLHFSQRFIGLTIVAFGTSLPELVTSLQAARKDHAGIAIGNIVGSNILNILIILGITAVITNVAIQKSTFRYEIPFMIGVTGVLLIFGVTGASITFAEGVIFWILFLGYLGYLFVMARKGEQEESGEIKDLPVWKCILFMVLGGIMVVMGSDFAVDGASAIARVFGMSERFIGLTIVAFGTSLPELVTSVVAARKGNAGIAIGNIVGSNIFNILFVIGTVALICPVPFEGRFLIDTVIAILCGILLWIGTIRHRQLRRPCGVIMLLAYAGYFVYLLSL